MRWLYLTVVVLFIGAVTFALHQNVEPVTMSFLGFGIRAPLAVLATPRIRLGAVSGGSVFALLRKSVQGSRTGTVMTDSFSTARHEGE